MDADLSHPPEKLPELVEPILQGHADFVIGSRFVKGGGAAHFNWFRKLNAWVSKALARPFTKVCDPMAGFFAFPRTLLQGDQVKLNPLGFKIGLELIVKANPANIVEVPIQFEERLHGESKLNIKEQIRYLLHLARLFDYRFKTAAEFFKFSLVGACGMVLDLFSVFVAYGLLSVTYRLARAAGFLFAVTSNFLLNRRFTFTRANKGGIVRRYFTFLAVCLLGFAINWFLSVELFENVPFFTVHYLAAAFVGILGGLLVNFLGSKFLAFR